MRRGTYSIALASVLLVGSVVIAEDVLPAQSRASARPDLSGQWQLNRELSENAETKLGRMQSQQGGGHGPGRHGGFSGFGRNHDAQMQEARALLLNPPASFVLTQDGDRIVITERDGHARTLTANGQKVRVDGQDVRTKWAEGRLVCEVTLTNGKLTETYERAADAQQLVITTKVDLRGHDVAVRRVYDSGSTR